MLTLALAATIADCADSVDQFIRYHLAIGFSRLYLFVDDNDSETYNIISRYPQVVAFLRNEELIELWKNTPAYVDEKKRSLIDTEVMVRQELNFCIAFSHAKSNAIDWLLHIDIDELFFPNGIDLQEHFKQLQIANFRSITYLNYESITTHPDASSIYLSSNVFKINYFKYKYWFFNEEQKLLVKNMPWLKEKYFNYYQNGKSCVSTFGNALNFVDVHSIIGDGRRKMAGRDDPIILHFPCARFSDFKSKYERLGKFSDMWMGYKRAGEFIEETHLNARDVFMEYGADENQLLEFYNNNFVLSEDQIATLLEYKLAQRIDFHQVVLSGN